MSTHAMFIVLHAQIRPPSLKLAALVLAERSNNDGGEMNPSLAYIAEKVGVSRPQARRMVNALKSKGLLSVVSNARGGAPGTTPRYQLHLDSISRLTGSTDATERVAPMRMTGSTDAHGRVATMHETGVTSDTQYNSHTTDGGEEESLDKRRNRARTSANSNALTFTSWLARVSAESPAVPEDDPIFEYSRRIDLPREFLALAWHAFKVRYTEDTPDKTYVDWRNVFRRAVRCDWFKLWRPDPAGGYTLTTAGVQMQRAMEAEKHGS